MLLFVMYMAIACFLSDDAYGAINETIAFVMLRWLFRGIIWLDVPVVVPVLASVKELVSSENVS